MLVHRGRRTQVSQFVHREPILLDARNRPIIRSRIVTHLPLQRERSDVDINREPNVAPVLSEDMRRTLEGARQPAESVGGLGGLGDGGA
jgi:hypothetical protein